MKKTTCDKDKTNGKLGGENQSFANSLKPIAQLLSQMHRVTQNKLTLSILIYHFLCDYAGHKLSVPQYPQSKGGKKKSLRM
jgi:hypothetical protein